MASYFKIFEDEKYYVRQVLWLENQLKNYKEDSFSNFESAKYTFEQMGICAITPHQKIDGFRNDFVSDIGLKKLNTSLKIFKKRSADKRSRSQKLDVVLDLNTISKLDDLVAKSGLTKKEIIKQLIQNEYLEAQRLDFDRENSIVTV